MNLVRLGSFRTARGAGSGELEVEPRPLLTGPLPLESLLNYDFGSLLH